MSLWLDSLCREGWGSIDENASREVQICHAAHIIIHMAMETPRRWWEITLQDSDEQNVKTYAKILFDIEKEFGKVPWLLPDFDAKKIIALAFIDKPPENAGGIYSSPDVADKVVKNLTRQAETAMVAQSVTIERITMITTARIKEEGD